MTKHSIKVCMGSSCFARGNSTNLEFLERYIKEHNLDAQIELLGGLCNNECSSGPNIYIDDVLYREIDTTKLEEILSKDLV